MAKNINFFLEQLEYEIKKSNDPPILDRYKQLVSNGKIDITKPNDDGLSIESQINNATHIDPSTREKIIECCKISYKKPFYMKFGILMSKFLNKMLYITSLIRYFNIAWKS